MPKFIFSTLTGSQKYTNWDISRDSLPTVRSYILIHGGANVANKHLWTPKGTCTEITDGQWELLKDHPSFLRHLEGGFLKVEDAPHSVDEVAPDMTAKDASAPLTPDDFEPGKGPTVGKASEEEEKEGGEMGMQSGTRPGAPAVEKPGSLPEEETSQDPPPSGSDSKGGKSKTRSRPAGRPRNRPKGDE